MTTSAFGGILSSYADVICTRSKMLQLTSFCTYQLHSLSQLTSLGPVLASFHSGAVVLMSSRGSSHDTPKYIEIDTVCNAKQ